jgi:hypothetical protein
MRILEVNDESLIGCTQVEAANALRKAGAKVRLLVCDGFDGHAIAQGNVNGFVDAGKNKAVGDSGERGGHRGRALSIVLSVRLSVYFYLSGGGFSLSFPL